jgi:hypothetical protein
MKRRNNDPVIFKELMTGAGEILRWNFGWLIALISFAIAFATIVGYFNLVGFIKYLCLIPAIGCAYVFFRTCFWPEGLFAFLAQFLPKYQKAYILQATATVRKEQEEWEHTLESDLNYQMAKVDYLGARWLMIRGMEGLLIKKK